MAQIISYLLAQAVAGHADHHFNPVALIREVLSAMCDVVVSDAIAQSDFRPDPSRLAGSRLCGTAPSRESLPGTLLSLAAASHAALPPEGSTTEDQPALSAPYPCVVWESKRDCQL
jgi:hypothetical protein